LLGFILVEQARFVQKLAVIKICERCWRVCTEMQKYPKPWTCTCSCLTTYCCWPESKKRLVR